MHFYHLQENIKNKGLDAVVHKVSEYLGNKISDAVTRSNDVNIGKQ